MQWITNIGSVGENIYRGDMYLYYDQEKYPAFTDVQAASISFSTYNGILIEGGVEITIYDDVTGESLWQSGTFSVKKDRQHFTADNLQQAFQANGHRRKIKFYINKGTWSYKEIADFTITINGIPTTVTVTPIANAGGTVSGGTVITVPNPGEPPVSVILTATPNENYAFEKWTIPGGAILDTPTINIDIADGNQLITQNKNEFLYIAYFQQTFSPSIYIGSSLAKEIYVGTSHVKGVYAGTERIF